MATLELTKKVHYIGVWLEDVFTDQIVQNIAAHAKASKGKKVKVILNSTGLRVRKTKWFQEKLTEYYPLVSVKTVTKNPVFSLCVMVILTDARKKYRILALKCASEPEAIHMVTMFSQIRRDNTPTNVELKKRNNGNWTLRDRSTHNANRHLNEVFNEQQLKPNNDTVVKGPAPNGDISNHVPILDESKVITTEPTVKPHPTYIKRNGTVSNNNNVKVVRDDDDYVIETEVSSDPYTKVGTQSSVYTAQPSEPEVTAFRDDLDTLTSEVRDIKTMLSTMQTKDESDGPTYAQVLPPSSRPGYNPAPTSPREPIYANPSVYSDPVVYRSTPRNYEATLVTSRRYNPAHDPWASHRRLSGNFILPAQLDRQLRSGNDSVRSSSSQKVKFDNVSIKSGGSTLSRIRLRKSVPSTIVRPIEQAYGRQSMGRRHNSISHLPGRPVSVHVVGGNELAVYQNPQYHRYMDVPL